MACWTSAKISKLPSSLHHCTGPCPLGEISRCSSRESFRDMLGSSWNFRDCPPEKSCFVRVILLRSHHYLDGSELWYVCTIFHTCTFPARTASHFDCSTMC